MKWVIVLAILATAYAIDNGDPWSNRKIAPPTENGADERQGDTWNRKMAPPTENDSSDSKLGENGRLPPVIEILRKNRLRPNNNKVVSPFSNDMSNEAEENVLNCLTELITGLFKCFTRAHKDTKENMGVSVEFDLPCLATAAIQFARCLAANASSSVDDEQQCAESFEELFQLIEPYAHELLELDSNDPKVDAIVEEALEVTKKNIAEHLSKSKPGLPYTDEDLEINAIRNLSTIVAIVKSLRESNEGEDIPIFQTIKNSRESNEGGGIANALRSFRKPW